MSSVFQPILEKGIVDHSILHKALMEYFSIADQSSAADIIQQLSGPLLVRMVDSREGSRIAMLCVKHGSAKERKKIIKGMKGYVGKIAHDQCGSMVLVCILSIVDDTKLVAKAVIRELQTILKDLVLDKGDAEENSDLDKQKKSSEVGEDDEDNSDTENVESENLNSVEGGKKDPFLRRQELLVNSGLAESLIDTCIESAGELLTSNFGKEVLYEVATGGADGILHPTLDAKLDALHETIATLVAQPKSEGPEEEHLFENFHSSRTIRRLVLDCPTFASILWKKALKGKCKMWAQGHSSRVVCAFSESSDSTVRDLAREELQPLIDGGILKLPENKPLAKAV
ncbi:pumilio 24 [Actinidia rufa]|uniref:Pumilio 24 n=1 Tax=Actinidia rufa TaxID=165716 RepID=A0A7J0GKU3_9ERIC|nr:pumilio 24 [Actinidia rufa]